MATAELVQSNLRDGNSRANVSWRALAAAEDDLEWWHGPRVAELGESAQGYEGCGLVVFDEEASCRLHERATAWRRVSAVRRSRRVGPRVGALAAPLRATAVAIYRPWPWPPHLRAMFDADRKAPGVVTLVGAALLTETLSAQFAKSHGGNPPAGKATLLAWLSDAVRPRVEKGKQRNEKPPGWVRAVTDEALEMRAEVLAAYAGTR
jgi:hypothetical protein